jgi:hypothetical protein
MLQHRMRDMGVPGVASFEPEPSASWLPSTTTLGGLEAGEGGAGAGETAIARGYPRAPKRPAGHGRDPGA